MASSSLAAPPLQRDADIWLEDGSIILIASHRVAFRIYKRLLAYHATVFDDMLSVGQPGSKGEAVMDGIPTVDLEDAPDALRIFLLVLMCSGFGTPRWTHPKLPSQMDFATFDALVRIAHKYDAVHILPMLWADGHLLSLALAARNGLWGDGYVCPPHVGTEAAFAFTVVVDDDDVIAILDLARCIGADNSVTAAMLWLCCLQGPLFLRDGVSGEGTVTHRLSDDDYVRCVRALPRLFLARREIVIRTLHQPDPNVFATCRTMRGICENAVRPIFAAYARDPPPMSGENPDPKEGDDGVWYGGAIDLKRLCSFMCAVCYGQLLKTLRAAFDTYWREDLPTLFEL